MLTLNISQELTLLDSDPLNNVNQVIGTCFDDPNSISITDLTLYDSGRRDLPLIGNSITIAPSAPFYMRFIVIETRLPTDITFVQPSFVRNMATVPANTFTVNQSGRLVVQYGLYTSITITSVMNNNVIKYLILGETAISV